MVQYYCPRRQCTACCCFDVAACNKTAWALVDGQLKGVVNPNVVFLVLFCLVEIREIRRRKGDKGTCFYILHHSKSWFVNRAFCVEVNFD